MAALPGQGCVCVCEREREKECNAILQIMHTHTHTGGPVKKDGGHKQFPWLSEELLLHQAIGGGGRNKIRVLQVTGCLSALASSLLG